MMSIFGVVCSLVVLLCQAPERDIVIDLCGSSPQVQNKIEEEEEEEDRERDETKN